MLTKAEMVAEERKGDISQNDEGVISAGDVGDVPAGSQNVKCDVHLFGF
jgi:hypothetical protein